MRLYLDEDTAAALLVQLLRQDGHDVETPAGTGLMGEWDPVQLTYAIKEDRVFLTRNYEDFEDLHNLVVDVGRGHHPGILVIRRDNSPRRNMAPRDIVRALRNLEAAGVPITDQYIVLNGWQ
jgi:predicted nuclease of predicted toxin-antitoxin system